MKITKYLLIGIVMLLTLSLALITNLSGIPAPTPLPEFLPSASPETKPSAIPDRVFLTMTEQPDRSVMVHWRSSTGVNASKIQVMPADSQPDQPQERLAVSHLMNHASYQSVHHHALVTGLTPGSRHRYRVGDGQQWSEWFSFTTATTQPEPFTFTFFGDIQEGLQDLWPEMLRQAQTTAPHSRFNLFVGDLIDHSPDDRQWQAFFAADRTTFARFPIAATPGNHEYDGETQEREWAAHFRFPANGPEGSKTLDNSSYYFDYQGVRFISVNTNVFRGLTLKDTLAQRSWLKGLLKENPNPWTIVFQHVPVETSIKGEKDSPELKLLYAPLYKQYGVDLVLQGDDHTYARGQITDDSNRLTGPVYITANSGSKTREVEAEWATVTAENTPLFQVISIEGDTLRYESKTVSGDRYDAFELRKQGAEVVISDLAIKQPQR